jgi:hypothetical protein
MKLLASSLAPLIVVTQLLLWAFFASELRVVLLPDLRTRYFHYLLLSQDGRKMCISAPTYTRYGTIYTILGIASGLVGRQAGRPACCEHWVTLQSGTQPGSFSIMFKGLAKPSTPSVRLDSM